MPVIKLSTYINADIKLIFDLSRSIDLHKLSTQHTNEEAIAGKTSGLIGLGETVTWKAKHFGIYQILKTKITEFDSPNHFTDEMISGAFKSFVHQHLFKTQNQGTLMIDVFDYQSPLGLLGKLADLLFLEKYMKNLLVKRNLVIKEIAETGKWKALL